MASEWKKKILYQNKLLKIKIYEYKSTVTHRSIVHSIGLKSFDEFKVRSPSGHTLLKRRVFKKNAMTFLKKLQKKY